MTVALDCLQIFERYTDIGNLRHLNVKGSGFRFLVQMCLSPQVFHQILELDE
uniref:Uncharacterized protein n=1 Tax=viral metagenome TaxID=1070528 RepID=A0A6C0BK11_9ZZZZ